MARKELSALNRLPDDPPEDAVATETPQPMPMGLRVEGVGRSFGQRQVVKNVSLSVQRGEVCGLLGPNGAGKTTCFYMITGLIPADYGSIWLDGEDITRQPDRAIVGRDQTGDHVEAGRLARAVGAQQAADLAALDAERDVLDHLALAERAAHALDPQTHGHGRGRLDRDRVLGRFVRQAVQG